MYELHKKVRITSLLATACELFVNLVQLRQTHRGNLILKRFQQQHCLPYGILTESMKVNHQQQNSVFTNKQDLTRFAIQAKGPDGKWTRKPLAYRESNNVHLLITRPPEICVNLVFKHIHAASSYTICRQFVPFIYCPL